MTPSFVHRLALATAAVGLVACGVGRASPPLAPAPDSAAATEVAYRIDDHRFFELESDGGCFGGMLYFVDTAKGIRSGVVKFDPVMSGTTLIIDAANDQYLVAPVTRGGNTNCSSGGGACGGNKMPYSTDGGRTWQLVWAHSPRNGVMVSGPIAYNVDGADLVQSLKLTLPRPQSNDWKYLPDFIFKPRFAPVDTKVWCTSKPQGGQR